MAEYLAPGVYVEEFDSGVKAMEGVGTSTAGFVGLAEMGPVVGRPVLLTSFAEYGRRFGGYLSPLTYGEYRYLPNSVEQFFLNGGASCYVMRVAPQDAGAACSAAGAVMLRAANPGAWANVMQGFLTRSSRARTQLLSVQEGVGGKQYELKNPAGFRAGDLVALTTPDGAAYNRVKSMNGRLAVFENEWEGDPIDTALVPETVLEACGVDLLLRCGDGTEVYERRSLNPAAPEYLGAALQKSTLASIALNVPDEIADPLVLLGGAAEADSLRIELTGGTDGSADAVNAGTFNGTDGGPGARTGIEAFREITDVSIMAVPGVALPDVQAKLIAHCEGLGSRFAVLDAPEDAIAVDELNRHKSAYDTSYAALYAPWIQAFDPLLARAVFLPPSGAVAGIYARTDVQRGVFKAPANEVVRGCTGLRVGYNAAEQAKLNPNGVNLIRALPGQGIRVWGARTCSSDGNWKYVNVRRLFIFLEESIRANTNWAVFEPNDETLWARVQGTIRVFLTTQWRTGALMGATPDEAFFVDVGRTTMTQDDILNGRLICVIGVAPVRPAEFVIFRITQKMQES